MYKSFVLEHTVRIPAIMFDSDLDIAAFEILSDEFNGRIIEDIGFVILVSEVIEIGDGIILANDSATYHTITFSVVSFIPEMHEIVEGIITEEIDFGAFIGLGPVDGLCHVSQVMDDFVDFNNIEQCLRGQESEKVLSTQDSVRARIIAISMGSARTKKLGLTMRQPHLGKHEWIMEDLGVEDFENTYTLAEE